MKEYPICEMCLERTTLKTGLSELPKSFQVDNIKSVCFECEYQIDKKLEQLYSYRERNNPLLNIVEYIKDFIKDYKFTKKYNEHNFKYKIDKGYTFEGREIIVLIKILKEK